VLNLFQHFVTHCSHHLQCECEVQQLCGLMCRAYNSVPALPSACTRETSTSRSKYSTVNSCFLANIFMTGFKDKAIRRNLMKPKCWHTPHSQFGSTHHFYSLKTSSTTWTMFRLLMELDLDHQLLFPNILVRHHMGNSLGHASYRKPIHTDRRKQPCAVHWHVIDLSSWH
jgi:hypothetical protein